MSVRLIRISFGKVQMCRQTIEIYFDAMTKRFSRKSLLCSYVAHEEEEKKKAHMRI